MDKDIRKYHNLFLRGVDNVGRVKLNVNDGTELPVAQLPMHGIDKIEDMSVASPANGEALVYNSTTEKWENNTIAVGETNTASSVGATGVDVFKQKAGVDLEFRTVGAGSNKVTVTDASDVITVDVDAANVEAAIIGGADTQVQFNDSDVFNGDAGLVFDKTNSNLKSKKVNNIRLTALYTDLRDAIKNGTASPVAGEIHGEPGKTDAFSFGSEAHGIELASNTNLVLPESYKIDISKTATKTSGNYGLWANSQSNIVIDGGELDGNAAYDGIYYQWDHGITLENCTNVIIRNMYIHDFSGDGIYINGGNNIIIENCVIDIPLVHMEVDALKQVGRNGIAIIEGSNIWIKNCKFSGGLPGCIDIEANDADAVIDGIHIIDNEFISSDGDAMSLACGAAIKNLFVIGNHIAAADESGMYIWGGSAVYPFDNIVITDNVIENCTCVNWNSSSTETTIMFRGYMDNVLLENNIIKNSGGYGVYAKNDTGNIVIKNNKIYNSTYDGILIWYNDCQVDDNFVSDSGGHGIRVNASSERIRIKNNTVMNNGYHGIILNGASGTELGDIEVVGNTCYNNSQGTAETYNGIHATYSDNLAIENNICFDNQASATQKYGAEITNCDDITLGRISGHDNTAHLYRLKTLTGVNVPHAKIIGTWAYSDLAASTSWTVMSLGGVALGKIPSPADGYAIYISVYSTAAVTAGTVSCRFAINGTAVMTTTLTTSNPQSNYMIEGDPPKPIAEGQLLHFEISSDADLEPDGSLDVFAMAWIV